MCVWDVNINLINLCMYIKEGNSTSIYNQICQSQSFYVIWTLFIKLWGILLNRVMNKWMIPDVTPYSDLRWKTGEIEGWGSPWTLCTRLKIVVWKLLWLDSVAGNKDSFVWVCSSHTTSYSVYWSWFWRLKTKGIVTVKVSSGLLDQRPLRGLPDLWRTNKVSRWEVRESRTQQSSSPSPPNWKFLSLFSEGIEGRRSTQDSTPPVHRLPPPSTFTPTLYRRDRRKYTLMGPNRRRNLNSSISRTVHWEGSPRRGKRPKTTDKGGKGKDLIPTIIVGWRGSDFHDVIRKIKGTWDDRGNISQGNNLKEVEWVKLRQ